MNIIRGELGFKLMVLFLLVALMPSVLIGTIFLVEVDGTAESPPQTINLSAEEVMETITSGVWIVPNGSANVSSEKVQSLISLRDPARTLRIVVESDQEVRVGYIGTSEGLLVVWPDITGVLSEITPPFDHRERPWYQKALATGQTTWTKPYQDAATGSLAITCATPIRSEGEVVGVAGMDITLEALQDDLSLQPQYSFLVDQQGEVIMRPRTEPEDFLWDELLVAGSLLASKNPQLVGEVEKMTSGQSGSAVVRLDKGNCRLSYAPLTSVDWSLVLTSSDAELTAARASQYDENFRRIEGQNEILAQSAAEHLGEGRSAFGPLSFRENVAQTGEGVSSQTMMLVFLGVLILVGLLAGGIGLWEGRSIARSMNLVTEALEKVEQGELDARLAADSSQEMRSLSEVFSRMTASLRDRFYELENASLEKGVTQKEAEMSREVKEALLPEKIPSVSGYEISASYLPLGRRLGHFYDVFNVGEGRTGLAVAGVSGEGFRAVLLAALTKTFLRAATRRRKDTAEALEEVNQHISESNGMLVTCFCGVLDVTTHLLEYANAGHPFPVVVSSEGAVDTLAGGGIALGSLDQIDLIPENRKMEPGDVLVIYNDEVTEAKNQQEERFGTERLIGLVRENRAGSAEAILKAVESAIESHTGSRDQTDDPTLMIIKRRD